jgi:hypothetical protein
MSLIAVERRDADEGRELASVEPAEFRQFRNEGSGGHGANSRDGCRKVLGLASGGRSAHARVDIGVDFGEFFLEEGEMAVEPSIETLA